MCLPEPKHLLIFPHTAPSTEIAWLLMPLNLVSFAFDAQLIEIASIATLRHLNLKFEKAYMGLKLTYFFLIICLFLRAVPPYP
jgi:hypothetical protein